MPVCSWRRRERRPSFRPLLGVAVKVVGAMYHVDAEDAQRLLPEDVGRVQHADVKDDLTGRTARLDLKAYPPSSHGIRCALEVAGSHRVDKGEEAGFADDSRLCLPFSIEIPSQVPPSWPKLAADRRLRVAL